MLEIQTKRVYAAPSPDDGCRLLVDRIWPRGLTKERVQATEWLPAAAPSTELRQWFGHNRERWEAFKERYFAELEARPEIIQHLCTAARQGRVTLLFAAQDCECNQAVALREYLLSQCR